MTNQFQRKKKCQLKENRLNPIFASYKTYWENICRSVILGSWWEKSASFIQWDNINQYFQNTTWELNKTKRWWIWTDNFKPSKSLFGKIYNPHLFSTDNRLLSGIISQVSEQQCIQWKEIWLEQLEFTDSVNPGLFESNRLLLTGRHE